MSDQNQTEERLPLEEVADKIKGLISRSAKAKIEIGELLIEYTSEISYGGKEQFYKDIGMSERTAQHYIKIARNEDVQQLKAEGKFEGLNMLEILKLVGMRVNARGANNANAPEQEYIVEGYGKFNFDKRHTIKVFQAEYKELNNKVTELEAELGELRSKTA